MIIEMFGLPYAGKSNFALYVLKKIKNYELHNYRSFIYKDLLENNKINYIEYFYLRLIEKRREQIHNNNFFFRLKILLLNFLILLLPISYERISLIIKKNYKKFLKKNSFLNLLYSIKKKNESVVKVISWVEQETIGHNLSKIKKKHTLLNSEGIIQRCLSLLIRLNLSERNMNKFLSICPKPDILIIFNDTKILKKFTTNMNAKKRKNFIKKFNLLTKLINKNLKKAKIFQFSLENREQILLDLRKYIR